ncbi:MAG: YtxH domain-containing protein [Chitinophagaceae bacterium]|jgi:gas vesicle protein|nr:YtxH domain-containing protein [Chitinophagaceae bacterium]
MSSSKHILIGTVAGIVAGAVAGLLLAPQSGAETRHQISDSAVDLKKRLKKLKNKANDEFDDLKEVFATEIEGLSSDVRERVLTLIEKSKASFNNLKNDVEPANPNDN